METKQVKAVCTVEINVECESTWSDDTTMAQIVDQATKDAVHRVTKLFSDAGSTDADLRTIRQGCHGVYFTGVKRVVARVVG